jgi:hypothetical protein
MAEFVLRAGGLTFLSLSLIMDNRRKASVIQYLRQLNRPERVRTVVSDLWQP